MEWLEFAPWSIDVVRELAAMHASHLKLPVEPKSIVKRSRARDREALRELLGHTEPRNPWGHA